MPGTIHQSTGEEASAVGMLYDLRKSDWMASTHRPAGHDIAKGISVKAMMCEMFGAAEGCCKGIGGAMHTGDISVGAMTANAIVGGNLPIAAGAALAFKMRGEDNVVVCFFGDGASNEGSYHETMNAAGLWKLPVIYVCENNGYSANTSISLTCCQENVAADRAAVYGIPSEVVDGNDVLAVNEAATRAIARAARERARRFWNSRHTATADIPATMPAATGPRTRKSTGFRSTTRSRCSASVSLRRALSRKRS